MSYDITESGKRIRQLRIQKGCTQEEVTRTLNIDRSFYGRIESGNHSAAVPFPSKPKNGFVGTPKNCRYCAFWEDFTDGGFSFQIGNHNLLLVDADRYSAPPCRPGISKA